MKWMRRLLKEPFLKFAIVGGLGTVTNLLVFLLLADKLHWNALVVSVISFCLAVSQNYLLNAVWTFSRRDSSARHPRLFFRQYLLFVASSLVGLGVNLAVLYVLLRLFAFRFKTIPQAAGILCGMVLNYLLSTAIVFKKGRTNEPLHSSFDGAKDDNQP
jgi:putative flippase GtrA